MEEVVMVVVVAFANKMWEKRKCHEFARAVLAARVRLRQHHLTELILSSAEVERRAKKGVREAITTATTMMN
jgi:hypothetical protein